MVWLVHDVMLTSSRVSKHYHRSASQNLQSLGWLVGNTRGDAMFVVTEEDCKVVAVEVSMVSMGTMTGDKAVPD